MRILLSLCLTLALAACGGSDDPATQPTAAPTTPVPSEVTGDITDITTGTDESDVTAFVVETTEGETYDFLIDPEIDYGFDLVHLFQHQEMGDPVLVEVDDRDGSLYALRIDDA